LSQILGALNTVHLREIVHRGVQVSYSFFHFETDFSLPGITVKCIGLASQSSVISPTSSTASAKIIKLGKTSYHTQLMDLHRSNPFGTFTSLSDDIDTPEAWYVLFHLCHCM